MHKKPQPSLNRLFELQDLLLTFRDIKRIVHLPGGSNELENDVEHSYALAITAWFIAQYYAELNTNRVIQLALAHDLLEVHAGDTFFYATDDVIADKKQREKQAVEQIKIDWKDFPELADTIDEYEALESPESCFVYALDKIMPILVVFMNQGYTWHDRDITYEILHKHKKDKISVSPEVNHYYQALIKLLQQHPHYFSSKQM